MNNQTLLNQCRWNMPNKIFNDCHLMTKFEEHLRYKKIEYMRMNDRFDRGSYIFNSPYECNYAVSILPLIQERLKIKTFIKH